MTDHNRRDALQIALAVGALSSVGAAASASSPAAQKDWEWLVGRWAVRHRRLQGRLVGSTRWEEFEGTCVNWPLMGGFGNVDDNVLQLPSGTYQGVGVRTFDPTTGQWSIWWIDSRTHGLEPPVRGGFQDGVGTFIGDDVHDGRPVKVRFRWLNITATSARWEQAYSPDDGRTWEINWEMDFTRVA